MFDGYLQLGGKEIVNVARTEAYVRKIAPNLPLKPCVDCDDLAVVVGDDEYESPMVDSAPWYDPNQPETNGFFGFYPLEVENVESSTRTADVTNSIHGGGTVGEARFGPRTMRWRGVLVAKDKLALEAGQAWLRAALTADPCTSHGGSCGGAMMCYFAACPCFTDMFATDYTAGGSFSFANATATETFHQFRALDDIWKARLVPTLRDGLVISWGVTDERDSSSYLEQFGPVVLRRTNNMPNPSFTRSLTTWTAASGTTASRLTADGVDGTGYAHIRPTSALTVRRNYFADPGFENFTPAEVGITSGTDQEVAIGQSAGAWQGQNYLQQQPTTAPVGESGFYNFQDIRIPILGPETPTPGTISFYVRRLNSIAANRYLYVVTDPDDSIVYSDQGDFADNEDWARVSFGVTFGVGYTLRIVLRRSDATPIASVLTIDGLQAELGSLSAWFSGDTPDEFDGTGVTTTGSIYSYEGNPATPSTAISGNISTFTSADMTSDFGAGTVAQKIRAVTPGTIVSVMLRNATTDAIITSAQVNATADWLEYSFPAAALNGTYVQYRAIGEYHLDQVIVEVGAGGLPYFDPDQTDVDALMEQYRTGRYSPEYVASWTTGVDGPSRLLWQGEIGFGYSLRGEYDETREGACDAVPFLEVHQGLMSGTVEYEVRQRIGVEEQTRTYERYMHDVAAVEGPIVLRDYGISNGAMREVSFALVAGVPHAFGSTITPLEPTRMIDLPTAEWIDPDCSTPEVEPILDPDCPPVPPAPRPPAIPNACITPEDTWQRYWLEIPAEFSSVWSSMVPAITIASGVQEIRQIRVRVFPNPFNYPVTTIDPCSWCAEFILSYLPPQTELTVDALTQTAFAAIAGSEAQPASALLYGSDGGPMSWPALSCGIPYVITIDVPEPLLDDVTVGVDLTRREEA